MTSRILRSWAWPVAVLLATTAVSLGWAAPSASGAPAVQRLWATRYNGPGNAGDSVRQVGVSPDGSRVYVTGNSYGGASFDDYLTVAYDAATGAQVWATRYNDPGNGHDYANALGVSPDGSRVYVTGYALALDRGAEYATIAYDAVTGAQVGAVRAGTHSSDDYASDLVVSPTGGSVYVTGTYRATTDYGTIAYPA